MKNEYIDSGGIGILGVLQIIFIVLKLVGIIAWSWWAVCIPLWIELGLALIIIIWGFIRNRRAIQARKNVLNKNILRRIKMDNYTATEQTYKNDYEAGEKEIYIEFEKLKAECDEWKHIAQVATTALEMVSRAIPCSMANTDCKFDMFCEGCKYDGDTDVVVKLKIESILKQAEVRLKELRGEE